jgi:hypothetical protein
MPGASYIVSAMSARQATNAVVNPFDAHGHLFQARIGKAEYG